MIAEERYQAAGCELLSRVARGSGSVQLRVTGFSMLPAIWPGDVLTVEPVPPEELRLGQIVLYRRDGGLVAHRVTGVPQHPGEAVVTRGDSIPTADAPVDFGEMVGEVVAIRRRGRAVRVEGSRMQRAAAWVLRRSEVSTRVLMGWSGVRRRLVGGSL